jgi:hypothetical protein
VGATSALRDAVGWSLAQMAVDSRATARADAAVARCLAALDQSVWPEVVTRFSGLNADGCPLELAFSSRDQAVRFTCEAGVPELDERQRLAHATRLAAELGCVVPEPQQHRIAAMQVDGPLAWGAAIAGRHDASGDRYKLYVEPQPASLACHAPVLAAMLQRAALQRAPRLVMIGCDPDTGTTEHYLRSDGLAPGELAKIAAACGFADRWSELAHAISLAWEGTADRALQGVWGLSFALSRDGDVAAMSVFKEVNRLFGGDAVARSRLLRLVAALDAGSLDAYARVSEPLATSPSSGVHGMLAITIAIDRPLELRVGLSPLAAWHAR